MRNWQKLGLLALGHAVNDFIAGYLLGNLLHAQLFLLHISIGFLAYNALAFGGQYFAALFIVRHRNKKFFFSAIWFLNAAAIAIFHVNPQISLIFAGCASAFYHVLGGSIAASKNRATDIGVFAAPGILGLVLAGYFAWKHIDIWTLLLFVSIGSMIIFSMVKFSFSSDTGKEIKNKISIEGHDVLMILLLSIIAMRSAVWNIFQIIHNENYYWLFAIAISAFAGKILGGWVSDKVGWKFYNIFSLAIATPLVGFFKEELLLFCIGIGLLQSAIPANTALLIQYMNNQKEKAIGFSFGLAVVAATVIVIPFHFFKINYVLYFLFALLIFGAIAIIRRKTLIYPGI